MVEEFYDVVEMVAPVNRDKQRQFLSKVKELETKNWELGNSVGKLDSWKLENLERSHRLTSQPDNVLLLHALCLNKFWQRFLLVQGIGWLGGLGILGSNPLGAQTQASIDTIGGASKAPQILPKAAPTNSAGLAPRSTGRRTVSRERASIIPKSTAEQPAVEFRVRSQPKQRLTVATGSSNSYIDTTDYSVGATRRSSATASRSYDAPSAVILSERATGCQRVSRRGAGVSGRCGGAVARSRIATRNSIAFSDRAPNLPQRVQSERPTQIGRLPHTAQSDRLARISPNLHVPKPSEVEYIPNNSQNEQIANDIPRERPLRPSQIASRPQRQVLPRVEVGQVKIGPVIISNSGIRIRRQNTVSSRVPFRSRDFSSRVAIRSGAAGGILPPINLDYYNPALRPEGLPGNGNLALIFPLLTPAPVTSTFGWRVHPISGGMRFHAGTDLGAPTGTPVLAAYSGRVASASYLGGYGLAVILRHNGGTEETRYGHLSEILVQPGEWVEQGTVIGRVGSTGNSTGPHLHFEIREQTSEGWVATDPGSQLQYALAQRSNTVQTAQLPRSSSEMITAQVPQITIPPVPPSDVPLPEIIVPQTPSFNAQLPPTLIPKELPLNASLPEVIVPKTLPFNAQLPRSPLASSSLSPQAALPKSQLLSSQLPELKLFQFLLPNIKLPEFALPKFQLPNAQLPQAETPKFQPFNLLSGNRG